MNRRTLEYIVPEELDGRRVRSILQRELGLSAGLVTRLKAREGAVRINGEPVRTIDPVRAMDKLTVEVGDRRSGSFRPGGARLDVVWEDEDILIINKPAGMAVHGKSDKGEPTVGSAVAAYLGTNTPFHPVNRLDRGTTGLMCAAKTGYMHDRLRRLLHTDDFKREYIALAVGSVEPPCGLIDRPISRVGEEKRFGVSEGGAPSRTHYETLASGGGLTLLRVWPETGRTHQIRVHFAALGNPLFGDRLYGKASLELPRPALHSAALRLIHPLTREELIANAPLPEDIRKVLETHEIQADIL